MKMVKEGVGPRRLLVPFGVYLQARLGANPETERLYTSWTSMQGRLKAATVAWEASWEAVVIARAALEYGDMVLDNAVRKVAAAVKLDLDGNVNRPEYGKLFRLLPGEVVALPFAQEIEEVKALEKEIASGKPWKSAKALLGEFKKAREGMEKTLAAYKAARIAWRDAGDAVNDVEVDWRHAYRGTYGALVENCPADKRLIESFFYREREEAEETEPPTEGGA